MPATAACLSPLKISRPLSMDTSNACGSTPATNATTSMASVVLPMLIGGNVPRAPARMPDEMPKFRTAVSICSWSRSKSGNTSEENLVNEPFMAGSPFIYHLLLVVGLCLDLTGSVEWTVHAQSESGRSPVREAVLRDVGRCWAMVVQDCYATD